VRSMREEVRRPLPVIAWKVLIRRVNVYLHGYTTGCDCLLRSASRKMVTVVSYQDEGHNVLALMKRKVLPHGSRSVSIDFHHTTGR
jgi:hypothetical protein